jgi:two-component system CheB/CheR fusion protein
VGRPLTNFRAPAEISDLDALVKDVMSTLKPIHRELADRSKNRYLVRILPYRTPDNKIDGAVITMIPVATQSAGEAS